MSKSRTGLVLVALVMRWRGAGNKSEQGDTNIAPERKALAHKISTNLARAIGRSITEAKTALLQ